MAGKRQAETEDFRVSAHYATGHAASLWLAFLGFLLSVFGGSIAAAQANAKNVLVVFSFSDRGDYSGLNVLKSKLQAAVPQPLNFYVEYMEGRRLDDKEYEKELVRDLGHAYNTTKLNLVIVQSYTGLRLLLKQREALFSGVPIVFLGVDPGQIAGQTFPSGITGVTARVDVRGTIDLALHLHPDANTVAVITTNTTPDRYFLDRIQTELLPYRDKVREIDLVGLPPGELMESVASLPAQTVVLFQLVPQESLQSAIGAKDILAVVSQRLPTYSIFPGDILNHGGVGGVEYNWNIEVSAAVDEARRVLSGVRPENIPIVDKTDSRAEVDWRQLRHWHIPESALPPGTEVLYRPTSLWEQYRNYFTTGIVLIVAQAYLILGLLWQRARKRKAEAVLQESENRFRVMADTTPSMIWMCDSQGRIDYLNDRCIAFTGLPGMKNDEWLEYVHRDDIRNVADILSEAIKTPKPFSREFRLRRKDGVYRWMFDVASPRVNGDGSFAGFIGSVIDTTDQKLAQNALEKVSGQLIEAQEQERSRIARDLHDDICQRLAVLSIELEQAQRNTNGSPVDTKRNLGEIRKHCSEIANDVQTLSHQLHSSKLEFLGISTAIRSFCNELSQQHAISIEFTEKNVPRHLPKDVSLCLFRVAQEALHNALKYSGVSEFMVELTATKNEAQLVVSDAGTGFDVEEAKKNRGLGLVSMQERIHLMHGSFMIESKPGAGTRIFAVVPLVPKTGMPAGARAAEEVANVAEIA